MLRKNCDGVLQRKAKEIVMDDDVVLRIKGHVCAPHVDD